jgi:hypothetical protein
MKNDCLVDLPPLATIPIDRNQVASAQVLPIKLEFSGTEIESPAFLHGNPAFADHLLRVKLERMKVLARLRQSTDLDAPDKANGCALHSNPAKPDEIELFETVLSFDFTDFALNPEHNSSR